VRHFRAPRQLCRGRYPQIDDLRAKASEKIPKIYRNLLIPRQLATWQISARPLTIY